MTGFRTGALIFSVTSFLTFIMVLSSGSLFGTGADYGHTFATNYTLQLVYTEVFGLNVAVVLLLLFVILCQLLLALSDINLSSEKSFKFLDITIITVLCLVVMLVIVALVLNGRSNDESSLKNEIIGIPLYNFLVLITILVLTISAIGCLITALVLTPYEPSAAASIAASIAPSPAISAAVSAAVSAVISAAVSGGGNEVVSETVNEVSSEATNVPDIEVAKVVAKNTNPIPVVAHSSYTTAVE